jgi:hypothetical protein
VQEQAVGFHVARASGGMRPRGHGAPCRRAEFLDGIKRRTISTAPIVDIARRRYSCTRAIRDSLAGVGGSSSGPINAKASLIAWRASETLWSYAQMLWMRVKRMAAYLPG